MIFFDLDGTLLDYARARSAGLAAMYRAQAARLDLDEDAFLRAWASLGEAYLEPYLRGHAAFLAQQVARTHELFRVLGAPLDWAETREVYAAFLERFEASWRAFEDVPACLDALAGRRLGILTNGDAEQQGRKLSALGIASRFEVVVTPDDAGAGKPDPRIFRAACERAGVAVDACTYIGDDVERDVRPAAELGMRAIWLNRRRDQTALPPGAREVSTLAEVVDLLEGRDAEHADTPS